MESISIQKNNLRKEILIRRSEIGYSEWNTKSDAVLTHLFEDPRIRNASRVHCYISMNERKEVNTHPIIEQFLMLGKKVFVPITNFKANILEHCELKDLTKLKQNKWGVLEPRTANPVENPEVDLILVPLLAVDVEGNRLGYGKGFYDRFLSTNKATKLGLVFHEYVLQAIPAESFDIKLDGFISENGVRYL